MKQFKDPAPRVLVGDQKHLYHAERRLNGLRIHEFDSPETTRVGLAVAEIRGRMSPGDLADYESMGLVSVWPGQAN